MISHSDEAYLKTKVIMRGMADMPSDFTLIADFIEQAYGVRPVNIHYDIIADDKRPRLDIIFEFFDDEQKFRDSLYNYDEKKQKAIASQFSRFNISGHRYKTDNILITFSSFKVIAQAEANLNIPYAELNNLITELNEHIWQIRRQWASVTFFYYTKEEEKNNSILNKKQFLSNKYLKVLKKYDEFGYFNSSDFYVFVSSKEAFEKDYHGNWFYYDR